jgi:hypothetical protein
LFNRSLNDPVKKHIFTYHIKNTKIWLWNISFTYHNLLQCKVLQHQAAHPRYQTMLSVRSTCCHRTFWELFLVSLAKPVKLMEQLSVSKCLYLHNQSNKTQKQTCFICWRFKESFEISFFLTGILFPASSLNVRSSISLKISYQRFSKPWYFLRKISRSYD